MIYHSRPTIDKDDINSIMEALTDRRLSAGGITQSFIEKLRVFFAAKEVFLTPSGTSAIASALRLLKMNKDRREVIIPAYVCRNVAQAVLMAEATPIVVDINESDYNISYQDTVSKMTSHTGAIILPHIFGNPIRNMDEFLKLGVPIIENIAQSIGGWYGEKKLGTLTEVAICSFYATKMITTGEGGAVIVNSDDLLSTKVEREILDSFKMPDFQAALGLAQLNKLESLIEKRKYIARHYIEELKPVTRLDVSDYDENCLYYRFIIKIDRSTEIEKVITALNAKGVKAERYTDLVLNFLGLNLTDFPNTSRAIESVLSIPIYPSLSDDDVDFVVWCIKEVAGGLR